MYTPRDPDFAAKASRVLDLYARTWQGVALGDEEYVISADEKSQLQALRRRHPDQPPGPGRSRRVEFEYIRGGTLAYFAAYDVHRAQVLGTIAPKTGIVPFAQLVEHVMTTELVHLPIHASWLNQVEIYFSIVQRKAIKPGDFRDLDHLAERGPNDLDDAFAQVRALRRDVD